MTKERNQIRSRHAYIA